jgi:lysophospholipase L1-like esterase
MNYMKKILNLMLLLLSFSTVSAQYPRASLWTGDMANFASQDVTNGIPGDQVLFVGSSSFTKWTTLAADFPNSRVLNRGFGGSWMSDAIYYFDQLVKPYSPSQVVLYEGDNDLTDASNSANSFLDDVITMTKLIHIYYPNAPIIIISIKPSPSRQTYWPIYQAANNLIKSYAQNHSDFITFVDIWPLMLNSDGTANTSLYLSDMLHMTPAGYKIWIDALTPLLKTSTTQPANKIVFTESSHPTYHDPSWVNVTAPSTFTNPQAQKIPTDSTHFHAGHTSLKYEYQGLSGGDWVACVAAASWIPMDITKCDSLEFFVTSDVTVQSVDLPNIFLESAATGAKTSKLILSNFINSIPAGVWTQVRIPIAAFLAASPTFPFNDVKTVFMSQLNANSSKVKFFVDDMMFKTAAVIPPPPAGSGSVLFDFGAGTTAANWNNITDTQAANVSLIDDSGTNIGATLQITDPFYNGLNSSGTTSPSGDAAIFPSSVTSDNFFGHGLVWGAVPANPKGIFTISGLDPNKYYSFELFGSRTGVTDNREALYTITGSSTPKTATLDAANNISNIAKLIDIKPTPEGVITVQCEAGVANTSANKFYYLGAMKMTIADSPTALNSPSVKNWSPYYSNGVLKINNYTGLVKIFDVSGKAIYVGQSVFGQLPVTLTNGNYLVKTDLGNTKLLVR